MRPFPGVIFDLDGTLVDSIGDLADALNFSLRLHGCPPHEEASYRMMVGEGAENLVRRALPEERADELLSTVMSHFRARYAEHIADRTRPFDGVEELLSRLESQGAKLGVLSNKRDDFTRELVARLFPRNHFASVRGERAGVPRKPDPTAALEMAADFGLTASSCALVGDSAVDMAAATRAGMFGVGVLWGFRGRNELLEHGARATIEHPLELLTLER